MKEDAKNALQTFGGKEIRKVWYNEQWYFSIIDVIEVLTDSAKPSTYWSMLKKREPQLFTICEKLKFLAPDNKMRPTDCANTEGVLRIVMSVPSPKAEPLKLWLAQVGKERIEETEAPELAFERARAIYKAKGYPDDWIGYREKSINIRKELTDEWKNRGIKENNEYSILTATISKETFGLTPSEHSKVKGLEKQNLRDHMTTIELIISALSEEATRTIAVNTDAQGFHENHEAAVKGGEVGRLSRLNFEQATGQKVVSSSNYLHLQSEESLKNLPASDDESTDEQS
ncbi:MAG: Bro-N domain-containing protein [Saprospiraceae bacterium]|nr:Bro-N domain-containing protein [Saprospiraceae bacterium]